MSERDHERSAKLAYTCVRHYSLENYRFHKKAGVTVRMTLTQPGHKKFEVISEDGSALIRQRVLRKMFEAEAEASADDIRKDTQITSRNYDFELAGTEVQNGRLEYVLTATPKKPNKFMMRGKVWVDGEDFAVTRVQATPAVNPSVLIRNTVVEQQYQKSGAFWVPLYNHSRTDSFLFGKTEVSVDSLDYTLTPAGANP